MTLRRTWVAWLVFGLGCQAVVVSEGDLEPAGQRSAGFLEASLTGHPPAATSPLSRAAAYLKKGDEAAACAELAGYLANNPEHFEVRIHYAELLVCQARFAEARTELAQSIAQAQDQGDKALFKRLHCHGMLRDIAEAQDDDFGMYLHRGIGLYLVALARAKLPEPDGQLSVEGLLCRAAAELALARAQRPAEAQPCWYLHLVWSALGQQGPATRWLDRAAAAAPFTALTAAEHRGLQLAIHARDSRPF